MCRRHRQRGSTLVETAIVMAVVLALVFGIIDFGRAMYTYSYVGQLARQGARWAIVRGANCTALPTPSGTCPAQGGSTDIQPYLQSLNEGAMNASSISATLQWAAPSGNATGCKGTSTTPSPTNSNAPGCLAFVTVTYPFAFIMPYLPNTTINMSSTSQMVVSN